VRLVALAIVVAVGGRAAAEPTDKPSQGPVLKIDNCPGRDPNVTDDELRRRGAEHYTVGTRLYLNGDYNGAVEELVLSYCTIPYFTILKDIGQAYERNLDYESAIAYLERYVAQIPDDAKRSSQCDVDPQEDKQNQIRRVAVLKRLPAHIGVNTQPGGATITLENDRSIVARAKSGDDIAVAGGSYTVRIAHTGYETETHQISVAIGKPYTFSYDLTQLTGTLAIQVAPADARVFVDEREVVLHNGNYDAKVPAAKHTIRFEHPDRDGFSEQYDVLPNQVRRVSKELPLKFQRGKRQLVVASTIGGGAATGALLYAFRNTCLAGVGVLAGGGAALFGSYFFLDDKTPLGTSDLTVTSMAAMAAVGASTALIFTGDQRVVQPAFGAGLVLGAGAGYYFGEATRIKSGDAALLNSALLWGGAAGGMFALSFDPPREVGAGLVLTGLGLGGISGLVMTKYYDISRTHALLIDVGGVAGILGGLALESIVNPAQQADLNKAEQAEHLANYALGGMVVGLIGAGILSRNIDAPKLRVQPIVGSAPAVDGSHVMTYGFGGAF
jgi:hypothetical protein